jgi:hypothetical protein
MEIMLSVLMFIVQEISLMQQESQLLSTLMGTEDYMARKHLH